MTGSYLPLTGGTLTGQLNGTIGQFSGNLLAGTTSLIGFTSSTLIGAPTNGHMRVTNNAGTAGALLDFNTDGMVRFRDRENASDATITAGNATWAAGGWFGWSTRGFMRAPAVGVYRFGDASETIGACIDINTTGVIKARNYANNADGQFMAASFQAPAATDATVNAPAGQRVNLAVGGTNVARVQNNAIFPNASGTIDNGALALRWNGVFGVLGDFTQIGVNGNPGTAKFKVTVNDTETAGLFVGATKGLRISPNAAETRIEGTDQAGAGSQPLVIAGSFLTLAATTNVAPTVAAADNSNIIATTAHVKSVLPGTAAPFMVIANASDTLNGPGNIPLFRTGIAGGTELHDPQNVIDLANSGRFTAPSAGLYHFTVHTYTTSSIAAAVALFLQHKNSSGTVIRNFGTSHHVDNTGYGTDFEVSADIPMAAGERIECTIATSTSASLGIQASGGTIGGIASGPLTWFSGHKIG